MKKPSKCFTIAGAEQQQPLWGSFWIIYLTLHLFLFLWFFEPQPWYSGVIHHSTEGT